MMGVRANSGGLGDSAYSSSPDGWRPPGSRLENAAAGLLGHAGSVGFSGVEQILGLQPISLHEEEKTFNDSLRRYPGGRKAKRSLIAQAIMESKKMESCEYCQRNEDRSFTEKKKYFKELEHLRHGVGKALDQLSNYMSANAFKAFQESLQLDVHFFSGREDGDDRTGQQDGSSPRAAGGGNFASGGGGAGGGSPTGARARTEQPPVKDLSDVVARLEAELEESEKEVSRLQQELRKVQEQLRFASSGPPAAAGGGHGGRPVRTVDSQAQTDVVAVKGNLPGQVTGGGLGPAAQPGGGGGAAATGPTAAQKGGPGGAVLNAIPGLKGSGPGGAMTADDLQNLVNERDMWKKKTKEAEKKIKELEDEIKALRSKVSQLEQANAAHLKDVENLQARIVALEDKLISLGIDPKTIVVTEQMKGRSFIPRKPGAAEPLSGEASASDGKSAGPSAAGESGSGFRHAGLPDRGDGKAPTKAKGLGGGRSRGSVTDSGGNTDSLGKPIVGPYSELEEDPEQEKKPKVEMVDKCVGNGPGAGLQQEPCAIGGKSFSRPPPEMNKFGKTHETKLRTNPDAAAANPFIGAQAKEGLEERASSAGNLGSTTGSRKENLSRRAMSMSGGMGSSGGRVRAAANAAMAIANMSSSNRGGSAASAASSSAPTISRTTTAPGATAPLLTAGSESALHLGHRPTVSFADTAPAGGMRVATMSETQRPSRKFVQDQQHQQAPPFPAATADAGDTAGASRAGVDPSKPLPPVDSAGSTQPVTSKSIPSSELSASSPDAVVPLKPGTASAMARRIASSMPPPAVAMQSATPTAALPSTRPVGAVTACPVAVADRAAAAPVASSTFQAEGVLYEARSAESPTNACAASFSATDEPGAVVQDLATSLASKSDEGSLGRTADALAAALRPVPAPALPVRSSSASMVRQRLGLPGVDAVPALEERANFDDLAPSTSPFAAEELMAGKIKVGARAAAAQRRALPPQAEPYLVEVWDKTAQGHPMPAESELIKLGATAPANAATRFRRAASGQLERISTLGPEEALVLALESSTSGWTSSLK